MALARRKNGRELENCLRAAVGVTATTLQANMERGRIPRYWHEKAINKRNGDRRRWSFLGSMRKGRHKTRGISREKTLDVLTKCKYISVMEITCSTAYGDFEWDSIKDAANRKKHGISFELAIEAFADLQGVYLVDSPHSIGEERMQYVGQLGGDILVLIVFTERAAIRIISARKASKKEQKIYVNANG